MKADTWEIRVGKCDDETIESLNHLGIESVKTLGTLRNLSALCGQKLLTAEIAKKTREVRRERL